MSGADNLIDHNDFNPNIVPYLWLISILTTQIIKKYNMYMLLSIKIIKSWLQAKRDKNNNNLLQKINKYLNLCNAKGI